MPAPDTGLRQDSCRYGFEYSYTTTSYHVNLNMPRRLRSPPPSMYNFASTSHGAAMIHTGRHFLQIPGPTNVPDRILRAMDAPVIDHRSAEFASLGKEVLEGMRGIFQTAGPVVMYPASGTGAWEAALVNTLSPGDRVLLFETGHFSFLWRGVAEKFGIQVDYVPGNWRRGASAAELESRLAADRGHAIKAVMVVHNETSTGVTSRIPELRRALDSAHHPALLLVDTISSLASIDYRHDEWGVDVTIAGSQKGLMLPPGMSFNAISEKALRASENAKLAALLLGLAGNAEAESQRIFSVHAADQSSLRLAGSAAHDAGRGPRQYFPAA